MKELSRVRARTRGATVVSSSTRCGKETKVSTGSEDSVVGMTDPSGGPDLTRLAGGAESSTDVSTNRTTKAIRIKDLSARAAAAIPGHTLEKDLLSEALRQHYQSVLNEPLPDALLQLLGALPEPDTEEPL